MRDLDVEALSRRYGPMVLRRCRRLLGDEQEALDACQDVFVRVLRTPRPAARRLSVEPALSHRDQRVPEPDARSAPASPSRATRTVLAEIARAEEPGGISEARLLLDRLFGRHPESSRTMAVLHYVDGLTLEEVARGNRHVGVGRAQAAARPAHVVDGDASR